MTHAIMFGGSESDWSILVTMYMYNNIQDSEKCSGSALCMFMCHNVIIGLWSDDL